VAEKLPASEAILGTETFQIQEICAFTPVAWLTLDVITISNYTKLRFSLLLSFFLATV
jgi:hypothetical protein